MNLLLLIKSLLKQKKSISEITDSVFEKFPDATADEIKKAVGQAKTAIALEEDEATETEKKVEADKKSAADADIESKAKALAEEMTTKVLESIENPNNPFAKAIESAGAKKHEFKSFIADVVITKDDSWRDPFVKMVRADRMKHYEEAAKLSAEIVQKSKLYDDDYKQKVLRGDATTGSYAVPDEFSDMVFAIAQRSSYLFDNATKMSVGSDKMYLLGSGDVTFTEVADQSAALTESEPTLSQGSLDIIDAGAFTYIHDNLIADSNVNIPSLLANAYGRGLAKYIKRATTVGNVATTGDKLNGIFSTSGIGSIAVADPNGSISYDDLVDLIGGIDEVFTDGAHFELNRRELLKVMKLKDNNGRPLFSWPEMKGELATLLGYPVAINNQMPLTLNSTTGARTGGDTGTILFGNAREIQIATKGGFMLESSIHYKFINRQTTFRGFVRWAQTVMNASAWARLTGVK